jgi:hypothetical protein
MNLMTMLRKRISQWCRPLGLVSLAVVFLPLASATATDKSAAGAPDIDLRDARPSESAQAQRPERAPASPEQQRAMQALRQQAPALRMRRSSRTGAPSRINGADRPLTGPLGPDAPTAGKAFIERNLELLQLSREDIVELPLARNFVTKHNGVTHLTYQQRVNGVDVFQGEIAINLDKDRRVLNVGGEPMPNVHQSVNAREPLLTAEEAIARAAESAGVTKARASRTDGKVYFPLALGELRLAWQVIVEDAATPNAYQTVVDAVDGRILWRKNLTLYQAHGLVYPDEGPNPNIPTGTSTGLVPRQDVPFDATGFFGAGDSHFDWWNGSGQPDRNTTRSNNVGAKQDRDGTDDDTVGYFTTTGENFNPPLDLTLDPSNSTNAAITNLFFWNNRMHDFFYGLGFDESAGNFQVSNFGLGGLGGDPVQAEAQDARDVPPPKGPSLCNSNMNTQADGISPRMQIYQCNPPGLAVERDGDLDNPVMAHEYTHGVHSRLRPTNGFQAENEGWADYYALSRMAQPGDDLNGKYELGWWLLNRGVRRQPYSTDQSVFTRTYANINDDSSCQLGTCSNSPTTTCSQNTDCGTGNTCDPAACRVNSDCASPPRPVDQGVCSPEIHNTGELWAETLWIMRANLVRKQTFATGGRNSDQLVIDGMKLAAPFPDFLDARDGILTADLADFGGANQCLIWDAFARMGMGVSASTTGTNDITPVQGFDVPTSCAPTVQAPQNIVLPDVCAEVASSTSFQVCNTGAVQLKVTSITSSDPQFSVSAVFPVAISVGDCRAFTAIFDPRHRGPVSATLTIHSNDPVNPAAAVTAHGQGLGIVSVTCPANITVGNNAGLCSATLNPGTPVFDAEGCPVDQRSARSDGLALTAPYPVGTTSIQWTETDGGGDSRSCTQTIVVRDVEKPVITFVPADLTISSCVNANIGTVRATDNCGVVSITNNAPAKFPLTMCATPPTVVTWRVTDAAGNFATQTQRVRARLGDNPNCCPAGTNIILGTNASDVLVGTDGSDCILGRGGDNVIDARGGDDFISVGNGRNTIFAGFGNDTVATGNGDNTIDLGPGNDCLEAGSGNDTIMAGLPTDVDYVDAGGGINICNVPGPNSTVIGCQ